MASTKIFSRFYALSDLAGNAGFDVISPQNNSGGTVGTFTLSDLPASAGPDNQDVLGDVPNDSMQAIHTINGNSTPFTNREYVGQIKGSGDVVARVFSSSRRTWSYLLYSDNVYEPSTPVTISPDAFVLCFASGTRILTTRGEVAVEDLQVGDCAVTASGDRRAVIWTGHRRLGAEPVLPVDQAPIRIRAGAFGHGLPTRDLFLSPGHPVLVGADAEARGGVLVPVMHLVNGTTIARTSTASVTYWHVELDTHDILLAEGLAAESFLDFGCRPFFEEASDHELHNPDFVPPGLSARCRPVACDGPLVETERARLGAVFAQTLVDDCAWDKDAGCSASAA
jgi:hypothetical protein